MKNVNIIAPKSKSDGNYTLPIDLNGKIFSIKFDPGANQTVISVDFFTDGLSEKQRIKVIDLIKSKLSPSGEFISSSGAPFKGYLVHAKDVMVGSEKFQDFFYYLILENDRIVALLGEDFLDNCGYHHLPHGNIEINTFDDEAYMRNRDNSLSNEDFLKFIDAVLSEY